MFKSEMIMTIRQLFSETYPRISPQFDKIEFFRHGSLFACRSGKPQIVLSYFAPNSRTWLISETYLEVWDPRAVKFMVTIMSAVMSGWSSDMYMRIKPFDGLEALYLSDDDELFLPTHLPSLVDLINPVDHRGWIRRIKKPETERALAGPDLRRRLSSLEMHMEKGLKNNSKGLKPEEILASAFEDREFCPYCYGLPKLSGRWDDVLDDLPGSRCPCCNARLDDVALDTMKQLLEKDRGILKRVASV